MGLLVAYVSFALGVSFTCSLLEAAFLSVRVASLMGKKAAGNRGAALLLHLKQSRVDDAISAILILNTVANTLGATLAGAQAARVFGSAWVGVFSGVLTLMILFVSEIIPKTLGAVYASNLAGFVGHTLTFLMRLLAPALVVSGSLTRRLAQDAGPALSRGELGAIVATALREGAISSDEAALLMNLLRFNEVRVQDVMTPRIVTLMLPADATIDELLRHPEADAFSRIPLYRGAPDEVVGYVLQRDVVRAAAQGEDRQRPLETFMRPIWFIPGVVTVGVALEQFLERREPLAMVADEHGGVAGLVSLEDLNETLLGAEIVDESDRVADLRKAASELRERRLERLRKKRELVSAAREGES